MLRKALRRSFAAALLGLTQSVGAVELGEIISLSRVGGALRIEIELAATADAVPQQSSCFSLAADPPNPDGLPVVSNGRATLRTLEGRHSVIVNSNQRVGEAALLGLRLKCGFNAQRDYVLHLPPPEVAPAEVAIAAAPAAEMGQTLPGDRLPPRKPKPAKPLRRVPADRVAVSLTAADEALSRSLSPPAPADGPVNYAAAGADAVQLDADLRRLEATIARLRAEIEASTVAQEPARATATEPAALRPQPTASSAEPALAVVSRGLKPDTGDNAAYADNWPLGIAVGSVLLMLAALMPVRRWLQRRTAGQAEPQLPAVAVPPSTPRAATGAGIDDDAHTARGARAIEVVEPKSLLERAEFMLSFGRVDDATIALEEYIASNPKSAIEPWKKLLEIYRDTGRRHAFDALARRMHKSFNVAAPPWERSSHDQARDGSRATP